jgi:hypothetical protein
MSQRVDQSSLETEESDANLLPPGVLISRPWIRLVVAGEPPAADLERGRSTGDRAA